MSRAPLTGYDNEVRSKGCRGVVDIPICLEVFAYDAESAELHCASCNPSGQRPLGQANLSLLRPGPLTRQPHNLPPEGEGRLFFESQDELVSRDTNGAIQDVYQWVPEGVGDCEGAGGCVHLISSGNASGDSFFVDASDSGGDAFFITRQKLLPQDEDDRLDLYDARVGGGFPPGGIGPCSGDACKGPGSPPPGGPGLPTGGVGPPNPPRPCKPGFVKKQGKCVKKKHHKKHKHKRRGSR
jgi:hypothetical protein